MELTGEIAAIRDGSGDPARLVGEFRRAVLLVPLPDGPDGGLMSAVSGGIRWIYAFTDEEALARFAEARGDAGREWEFLSVLGARLVDAVIPAADGPAGVAVNVADEDGSMFFPPVAGIVPDGSAVDLAGAVA
ncbi:SseB family protein [Streptomyces sp. NBC_01264]|uniref:SseB family protein n=1 Tax=Streptomyces sp. NBC_01264 TaxID=2903804 RepID=UPI002256CD3E|nr:SseB family protein [Streptomyces sp. NBC_01264]MCX4783123.1 SseB family protein [Streptomyces sp. NBC_01264]